MSLKTAWGFLLAATMLSAGCIDRKHVGDASVPGEAGPQPDTPVVTPVDGLAAGFEVRVDSTPGRLDIGAAIEVGVDLPATPDVRVDMPSATDIAQGPETQPDALADSPPPPIDLGFDNPAVPDVPADAPPDLPVLSDSAVDLPWGPEAGPDLPTTGCVIAGIPYANGAPNPVNPCQVCKLASPSSWSNVDEGAVCSSGYCNLGTCKAGCFIQGAFYAPNAPNPSNACQTCQTSTPTSWSALAPGSACGAGMVCSGGTCQTGCWIQGAFVGSGAANASNTCQICTPSKTTSAWSNNDAATAVPCGSCGGTAACVSMALGPCSKNAQTYYRDADNDGYGNPSVTTPGCELPAGYVQQAGDCDDSSSVVKPGYATCQPPTYDTQLSCPSSGTFVTTPCPYGCNNTQCRTLPGTTGTAGWVTCGTTQCSTTQGCYFPSYSETPPQCGAGTNNYAVFCDGPNDCPAGQLCCAHGDMGLNQSVTCMDPSSCPYQSSQQTNNLVCTPDGVPCPAGKSCQVYPGSFSIYVCL